MTPDEQEALSLRYIAPRVLRLSSGRVALIHMVGHSRVEIIDTLDQIPTLAQLEAADQEYESRLRLIRTTKRRDTERVHKATLDDLA